MSPQSAAAGSDVPVDLEPLEAPQGPSERADEASGPHPNPAVRDVDGRTGLRSPAARPEGSETAEEAIAAAVARLHRAASDARLEHLRARFNGDDEKAAEFAVRAALFAEAAQLVLARGVRKAEPPAEPVRGIEDADAGDLL